MRQHEATAAPWRDLYWVALAAAPAFERAHHPKKDLVAASAAPVACNLWVPGPEWDLHWRDTYNRTLKEFGNLQEIVVTERFRAGHLLEGGPFSSIWNERCRVDFALVKARKARRAERAAAVSADPDPAQCVAAELATALFLF